MSERPQVSVIVCTHSSPGTLARALDSVLEQDIAPAEVIVVDDGTEPPVGLDPERAARVRLIRTAHRGSGAARAEGLAAVTHELVAYCDDDDEWHPHHLRTLLDALAAMPEADLVYGDSEWVVEGVPHGVPYSIDFQGYALAHHSYVFAGDALHSAEAARRAGGFDPSLQACEDWDLWLRMSHTGALRHVPEVIGTRTWHRAAVSARSTWAEEERVAARHQRRLAALGQRAAHGLAGDAPVRPFAPATWCGERRELLWHSLLVENHSFGVVARELIRALERAGVTVRVAPTRDQPVRGLEHCYVADDGAGRLAFYYDIRHRCTVMGTDPTVVYAMWESTRVPPEQVAEINAGASLLYVPSRTVADAYAECGVEVPIEVLHHGVDAARFPSLERPAREEVVFGTFGYLAPRKGVDVLVRAFREEFRAGEPVRLRLKSLPGPGDPSPGDERIEFVETFLGDAALLDFLQSLDVFVLPSRGEGFGLTGLEAMSTGLPLIATGWSGPAEYLDGDDSFALDYRLVDAGGAVSNHTRYDGQWAEPDVEHLRALLRWCFEHPAEARAMGQRAARRVHADWAWDRPARQMRDDLDALARRLEP